MDIDNKLNMLGQIKKVDAPPFLITRINEQINSNSKIIAPVKWNLVFAITTIFILTLNVSILFKSTTNEIKNTEIEEVFTTLNLSTTNELYHE